MTADTKTGLPLGHPWRACSCSKCAWGYAHGDPLRCDTCHSEDEAAHLPAPSAGCQMLGEPYPLLNAIHTCTPECATSPSEPPPGNATGGIPVQGLHGLVTGPSVEAKVHDPGPNPRHHDYVSALASIDKCAYPIGYCGRPRSEHRSSPGVVGQEETPDECPHKYPPGYPDCCYPATPEAAQPKEHAIDDPACKREAWDECRCFASPEATPSDWNTSPRKLVEAEGLRLARGNRIYGAEESVSLLQSILDAREQAARGEERQRCAKLVCEWCRKEVPLALLAPIDEPGLWYHDDGLLMQPCAAVSFGILEPGE